MLDHLFDAARRGLARLARRPAPPRGCTRVARIELPRWEGEGGSTPPEPVDTPVGRGLRDGRRGTADLSGGAQ